MARAPTMVCTALVVALIVAAVDGQLARLAADREVTPRGCCRVVSFPNIVNPTEGNGRTTFLNVSNGRIGCRDLCDADSTCLGYDINDGGIDGGEMNCSLFSTLPSVTSSTRPAGAPAPPPLVPGCECYQFLPRRPTTFQCQAVECGARCSGPCGWNAGSTLCVPDTADTTIPSEWGDGVCDSSSQNSTCNATFPAVTALAECGATAVRLGLIADAQVTPPCEVNYTGLCNGAAYGSSGGQPDLTDSYIEGLPFGCWWKEANSPGAQLWFNPRGDPLANDPLRVTVCGGVSPPTTPAPTPPPTNPPSVEPTVATTAAPTTAVPTPAPTDQPSRAPTTSPTAVPTTVPTTQPSRTPTVRPTAVPTPRPTTPPSPTPTAGPTTPPSPTPTAGPSAVPTTGPTNLPSPSPTADPTAAPTSTAPISSRPTGTPTSTAPTTRPTGFPTGTPNTCIQLSVVAPERVCADTCNATVCICAVLITTIAPGDSCNDVCLRGQSGLVCIARYGDSGRNVLGGCGHYEDPAFSEACDATGDNDDVCVCGRPVTDRPTTAPTQAPSTLTPTGAPSTAPITVQPTATPTRTPTESPTSSAPTFAPTPRPTLAPIAAPTTLGPTPAPTDGPTRAPTAAPTDSPTSTAPVTVAPTSQAPVTVTPTSAAPVTSAPTAAIVSGTFAPVTLAPVTNAPVTARPVSFAPVTSAPVTASPVSATPTAAPTPTAGATTGSPTAPAPPPATQSGAGGSSGDNNVIVYVCVLAILLLLVLIVVLVRKRRKKEDPPKAVPMGLLSPETSMHQLNWDAKSATVDSAATDTLKSVDSGMFATPTDGIRPDDVVIRTASHTSFKIGNDYAAISRRGSVTSQHDYARQPPTPTPQPEYAVPTIPFGARHTDPAASAYVAPADDDRERKATLYNVPAEAHGGTYSEPPRELFSSPGAAVKGSKHAPQVVRLKPKPPKRASKTAATSQGYEEPVTPPQAGNPQAVYSTPDGLDRLADPEYEETPPMVMIGGTMGPPTFMPSSYEAPTEFDDPPAGSRQTGTNASLYTQSQYTAFLDSGGGGTVKDSPPYDAFGRESNYAVAKDATPNDADKVRPPAVRRARHQPEYLGPPAAGLQLAGSGAPARPASYAQPHDAIGDAGGSAAVAPQYEQPREIATATSVVPRKQPPYAEPADAIAGGGGGSGAAAGPAVSTSQDKRASYADPADAYATVNKNTKRRSKKKSWHAQSGTPAAETLTYAEVDYEAVSQVQQQRGAFAEHEYTAVPPARPESLVLDRAEPYTALPTKNARAPVLKASYRHLASEQKGGVADHEYTAVPPESMAQSHGQAYTALPDENARAPVQKASYRHLASEQVYAVVDDSAAGTGQGKAKEEYTLFKDRPAKSTGPKSLPPKPPADPIYSALPAGFGKDEGVESYGFGNSQTDDHLVLRLGSEHGVNMEQNPEYDGIPAMMEMNPDYAGLPPHA